MSATTPVIRLEGSGAGRAPEVRAELRELFFSRMLWRACARVALIMACALFLLFLLGLLDYLWPMRRALRLLLVAPVFVFILLSAAHAVWSLLRRRRLVEMAREIERAAGLDENALVTYAESSEQGTDSSGAQPYMLARLEGQARRVLGKIERRIIAPRRKAARAASLLFVSLLFIFTAALVAPHAFVLEVRRIIGLGGDEIIARKNGSRAEAGNLESAAPAIEEFRVRVVPPAYSGLSAEDAVGDAPVRALAGSQIEVELRGTGAFESVTLSFGGAAQEMRALGDGAYQGSFTAQASGAFEARLIAAENLLAPPPIVRAVEVYPDRAPEARINEPAGDQLLRALPAAPVSVRWSAEDDLGLADVVLKYIRSRGEGDAAQFTGGSIAPGNIERAGARAWQGGASLDLARLGLQPGDTLVYWIEARDRNPAANNTGRSASLAIAIAAPEPVKLNLGDLGPNEIGRFLLSQRMIVIKTEKLHRERARLPRAELQSRAQDIAAEQREFKNSFNDYIKTEGAEGSAGDAHKHEGEAAVDEKQEAAEMEARVRRAEDERTGPHMHGIPEPPTGAPQNVRDLVYAIRAMWDAEEALSLTDTSKALTHEREALARLKRAQSAVRYVPPVVARSKPIDLKRRYAGELNEIKTRLEKLSRRAASKESQSLRSALGEAYAALGDLQGTLDVPVTARASALGRARERARRAADELSAVGGEHAATVAEATGQLRIVETELSRLEMGGTSEEYAARLGKPLSLLTQAAANLFAIAEATTRATTGETNTLLPADDARAAEYFRLLGR